MNTPRKRQAYTFAEVITVVAILGILVALMLPAVQGAREAARRTMCSTNLQQLIIAVHHYEMHHGVYPPGTMNQAGPIQSIPSGYHHNWLIQILPFLEERITYDLVDRRASVYDPRNSRARRIDMPVLHCASQETPQLGYGDYAGVHNDVEAPIDADNHGVFFLNSRMSYFDVKDGCSQTLFIGEKMTIVGDLGWMSGTRATLRNTGIPIGNHRAERIQAENLPPGTFDDDAGILDTLSDDDLFWDVLYGEKRELLRPRQEVYSAGPVSSDGPAGMMMGASSDAIAENDVRDAPAVSSALAVGGFGSNHPRGTQFAMGDGSVRFIDDQIDPQTYLQLGHRADQKLIEAEW